MCGCCSYNATWSAGPDLVEHISPNLFYIFYVFSYSPPFSSPKCRHMSSIECHDMPEENVVDCIESLGNFQGSIPILSLHYLYLEDLPRKITWSNFFHHSFDFSKVFDMFKRALTIMHIFMFKCSYLHSSELHGQVFDEPMQALTKLELLAWIFR